MFVKIYCFLCLNAQIDGNAINNRKKRANDCSPSLKRDSTPSQRTAEARHSQSYT